jgi:hypothetical protein
MVAEKEGWYFRLLLGVVDDRGLDWGGGEDDVDGVELDAVVSEVSVGVEADDSELDESKLDLRS